MRSLAHYLENIFLLFAWFLVVSGWGVNLSLAIASWPEVKVSRLSSFIFLPPNTPYFLNLYLHTLFLYMQWRQIYMNRKHMKSTLSFNLILFNPPSVTIFSLFYIVNFVLLKRWVKLCCCCFPLKNQIINILDFAVPVVSVVTIQFCYCSRKTAVYNT